MVNIVVLYTMCTIWSNPTHTVEEHHQKTGHEIDLAWNELSKISDSLLETPRTRTTSMASSKGESVGQNSASIH